MKRFALSDFVYSFNIPIYGPQEAASSYVAQVATRAFGKFSNVWSLKTDPKFITIRFTHQNFMMVFIASWRKLTQGEKE